MDVGLRAVREAFKIRDFEACYLEAMDETAARQGVPWRLPDCAPALLSTCRAFLDKLLPLSRARPRGPLETFFDPLAAQALGGHCGRIVQEKAGRTPGRGGGAEDSQRRRWGPLTECELAPPPSGVLVRAQPRWP